MRTNITYSLCETVLLKLLKFVNMASLILLRQTLEGSF
jgi:hypothetical protein